MSTPIYNSVRTVGGASDMSQTGNSGKSFAQVEQSFNESKQIFNKLLSLFTYGGSDLGKTGGN